MQALVQFASRTLLEFEALRAAYEEATEEEQIDFGQYFNVLLNYVADNSGLFITDPEAFIEGLSTLATDYETAGMLDAQGVAVTLRILDDLAATLAVLEMDDTFPIDLTGWQAFVADAKAFNQAYLLAHPLDRTALEVAIWLNAADDFLTALDEIVPTINEIAMDVEELEAVAMTTGIVRVQSGRHRNRDGGFCRLLYRLQRGAQRWAGGLVGHIDPGGRRYHGHHHRPARYSGERAL